MFRRLVERYNAVPTPKLMFRRLVQRFDAVPTPKLAGAAVGMFVFGYVFPWIVDVQVDRYIRRLKQNALKDTSGRRDRQKRCTQ